MMKRFFIYFFALITLYTGFIPPVKSDTIANSDITVGNLMMPYKDINYRWRAIKKLKAEEGKLTEYDKNVINKYVSGAVRGEDSFLLMNSSLNNSLREYISPKDITKPLQSRLSYYAKNLETSVAKAKLPQNMILYRGINEKDISYLLDIKSNAGMLKDVKDENLTLLKKNLIGHKFNDNGFMLTSYDKNMNYSGKYRLNVYAPKNMQAVLIENIVPERNKQILINKGYNWKIVDITKDYDKKNKEFYYKFVVKLSL